MTFKAVPLYFINIIFGKFYIFHVCLFYWPTHPNNPQGIRVASVIEFSVCLFVYLSVLGKFSNFFLQYKAAAVQ